MNKPTQFLLSKAISGGTSLVAITVISISNLTPMVLANPNNRERYDCYRKSNNQFSFGSHTDVSNISFLCTPNPHYRSPNRSNRSRRPSRPQPTSSRRRYRNTYSRRSNVDIDASGDDIYIDGYLDDYEDTNYGDGYDDSDYGEADYGDDDDDVDYEEADYGDDYDDVDYGGMDYPDLTYNAIALSQFHNKINLNCRVG